MMTDEVCQQTASSCEASPGKGDPPSVLTKCRPVRWSMSPGTDNSVVAVGHLLAVLLVEQPRDPDEAERLGRALGALILDLFATCGSIDPYLSCSLCETDRVAGEMQPSETDAATAADFMLSYGFAEGNQSRLRGTPLLVGMLTDVFNVHTVEVGPDHVADALELRIRSAKAHGGKRVARIEVTDETLRMTERIHSANLLRASVAIAAPKHRSRPGDTDLRRIFTNRNCQHGGRFAGGWWMAMPEKKRSRIRLDGEAVVELDYRTIQPRICFDLAGAPLAMDADIYAVPGYDPGRYREAVKATVARLLSVSKGQPLTRLNSVKGMFASPEDFNAFVAAVEQRLAPLTDWLRSGRGGELEWVESEVADEVVARLTSLSIPCLPVHDSFIVPVSAEQTLGRIMVEAYWYVLRRWAVSPSTPAISGWSSPEAREMWRDWAALGGELREIERL